MRGLDGRDYERADREGERDQARAELARLRGRMYDCIAGIEREKHAGTFEPPSADALIDVFQRIIDPES